VSERNGEAVSLERVWMGIWPFTIKVLVKIIAQFPKSMAENHYKFFQWFSTVISLL
jgi:hypothetical protein